MDYFYQSQGIQSRQCHAQPGSIITGADRSKMTLQGFQIQTTMDIRNENMPETHPAGHNSPGAQRISIDCIELARPNVHSSLDTAADRKPGMQRFLVARPVAV